METFGRYSAAVIFFTLAMFCMMWWVISQLHSHEDVEQRDTIERSGVLSGEPKFDSIVIDNRKRPYIEISLRRSRDVYWFIGCSYYESVSKQVKRLHEGDSIVLRVQARNSSTFEIREARSWNSALLFTLFDYNRCSEQRMEASNPLLAELLFGISVLLFINGYFQSKRDERLSATSVGELLNVRLPMTITPDAFIHVLRTIGVALLMLAGAAYTAMEEGGRNVNFSYFFMFVGAVALGNSILEALSVNYVIDTEGVEVTKRSLFSRKESHKIRFEEIDDVSDTTSFIERRRGVGTIKLSRSIEDHEKALSLVGIKDALKVGKLILDLATAKRNRMGK